jgi:hypothetical protein
MRRIIRCYLLLIMLGATVFWVTGVQAFKFEVSDTQGLLKANSKMSLKQYVKGDLFIFSQRSLPGRYWLSQYQEMAWILNQAKTQKALDNAPQFGVMMKKIPFHSTGYASVLAGIRQLQPSKLYLLGISETTIDLRGAQALMRGFRSMPDLKVLVLQNNKMTHPALVLKQANQRGQLKAVYFNGTSMNDPNFQSVMQQMKASPEMVAVGLTLKNDQQVRWFSELIQQDRRFQRVDLMLAGKIQAAVQVKLLDVLKKTQADHLTAFSLSIAPKFVLAKGFVAKYNQLINQSPHLRNIYLSLSGVVKQKTLKKIVDNLSHYSNKPFYLVLSNTSSEATLSPRGLGRLIANNYLRGVSIQDDGLDKAHYQAMNQSLKHRTKSLHYFSSIKDRMSHDMASKMIPAAVRQRVNLVQMSGCQDAAKLVGRIKANNLHYRLTQHQIMFGKDKKHVMHDQQPEGLHVTNTGIGGSGRHLIVNLLVE